MPLYYVKCCKCPNRRALLMSYPEFKAIKVHMCECGYTMHRDENPPGTQVMESLDNGAMARRVERLADAERLYKERNANADERAGK